MVFSCVLCNTYVSIIVYSAILDSGYITFGIMVIIMPGAHAQARYTVYLCVFMWFLSWMLID